MNTIVAALGFPLRILLRPSCPQSGSPLRIAFIQGYHSASCQFSSFHCSCDDSRRSRSSPSLSALSSTPQTTTTTTKQQASLSGFVSLFSSINERRGDTVIRNWGKRSFVSKTASSAMAMASASDPTAKRPNKLCDPYGQGGKPLTWEQVQQLLPTIHKDWNVAVISNENNTKTTNNNSEADEDRGMDMENGKDVHGDPNHITSTTTTRSVPPSSSSPTIPTTTTPTRPFSLVREFQHPDYLAGARFVARVAAVAEMNAHYPLRISLERQRRRRLRLRRRQPVHEQQQGGERDRGGAGGVVWCVVTKLECHTTVLGGLSMHDFHLAMLMDVEVERADVQPLLMMMDS